MQSPLQKYFRLTQDYPPSPSLLKAIDLLGKNNGQALDLGCGAGRDARLLLEKGFYVTVVDKRPLTKRYLARLSYQERLKFVLSRIEDFQFGRYDLINAHWVLHFIAPKNFNETFNRIKNSLNLGGILVGTLLGFKDEWNTSKSEMNFHSRNEVKNLFKGFEILELKEENKNGTLASGAPKHWHVFHFIAKK